MESIKKQIFVVEDDEKLRRTLEAFLTASGYGVLTASDGEEALNLYFSNNQRIDLILLDGMLPKIDGFDVLKRIREYSDVPIIMLTAREAEEDQLEGLESGADNYITKPFLLRVLKAHMEALLRRRPNGTDQTLRRGALKIEPDAHRVWLNGSLLTLTPKEYDLLIYFIQHENMVLSREMILDAVWGFDYEGGSRTVDTVVKQLRKKMTDAYPYIQSLYGVGYQFEVNEHDETP
ncbi:MAG: response regulator transcription factor [Eubacteriales bacterium]|nr:response regulator transcription factor [Eubacteriales bacterium]